MEICFCGLRKIKFCVFDVKGLNGKEYTKIIWSRCPRFYLSFRDTMGPFKDDVIGEWGKGYPKLFTENDNGGECPQKGMTPHKKILLVWN